MAAARTIFARQYHAAARQLLLEDLLPMKPSLAPVEVSCKLVDLEGVRGSAWWIAFSPAFAMVRHDSKSSWDHGSDLLSEELRGPGAVQIHISNGRREGAKEAGLVLRFARGGPGFSSLESWHAGEKGPCSRTGGP